MELEKYIDFKIIQPYKILKTIGHGSFSRVFLVENIENQNLYALKVVPKNSEKNNFFWEELQLLKIVNHPNIIKYIDFFEDNQYYFYVLEYIKGETLIRKILENGSLSESISKIYFQKIISAIKYLHEEINIIHRDIKGDNIIINEENEPILLDFGFGKKIGENLDFLKTQCGSIHYMAPEIILNQNYTLKVDIWSSGILLYTMITGYFPFGSKNIIGIMDSIVNKLPFESSKISKKCFHLLTLLLDKNPEKRPNASEILSHSWFLKIPKSIQLIKPNLFLQKGIHSKRLTQSGLNRSLIKRDSSFPSFKA